MFTPYVYVNLRHGMHACLPARYQILEKQTKTKAFSKIGLAKAAPEDPSEAAKGAASEWLKVREEEAALDRTSRGGRHVALGCIRRRGRLCACM